MSAGEKFEPMNDGNCHTADCGGDFDSSKGDDDDDGVANQLNNS